MGYRSLICLLWLRAALTTAMATAGIPDTTALLHRAWNYTLPPGLSRVQIYEAGQPSLPSWMYLEKSSGRLVGVPHVLGHTYLLLIAQDSQGQTVKDVFSIEVLDDTRTSCSDQTMAYLLLELDFATLSPQRQVQLIEALARRIGKSSSDLQLVPSDSQPDSSAAKPGVILRWLLECPSDGGDSSKNEVVVHLEKTVQDGTLSKELNASIISWHLSAQQLNVPLSREKRFFQHHQYNTPVPGAAHPSWFTTRSSSVGISDTDVIPESRIVPTMASPIYLGPSSTHPHRHHHGDDKLEKILPTEPYHRLSALYSTPIPFPDRPTIHVSPSFLPEEPTSPLLQPSLTPSPYVDPIATEHLPISPTPTVTIQPTQPVTEEPTTAPTITNIVPKLENHIQKLTMVIGKIWTYKIPADTFWDFEDGNTRSLKLFFYNSDRMVLPANSWIQFDPVEQELLALPMEEQIGTYEFILEAMDTEENTTMDRIEIDVWENPTLSKYHHSFIMYFKYDAWRFSSNLKWQSEIVKKLAEMYGDQDSSSISVLKITYNPHTLTWTNDSLSTDHCPRQEIEELSEIIIKENSTPTKAFKRKMQPDIRVSKVAVEYSGICILPEVPFVATTEKTTKDFAPIVFRPLDNLTLWTGDVLRYKIPQETFSDFEDGDTYSLNLTLLTYEERLPHKSSFMLLDPVKKELFGLPLDSNVGLHRFYLVATDKDGLSVRTLFNITIRKKPVDDPPNFEMVFIMEHERYDDFMNDLSRKVLLPWKIAHMMRDSTPKYVRITSIKPGSVHFGWTNSSLPTRQCAQRKVQLLVNELIQDKKVIRESALESFQADFNITGINFRPLGPCMGQMHPITAVLPGQVPVTKIPPPLPEVPSTTTEKSVNMTIPETTEAPEADIFVTTIIPAIVIAVLLVIAAMIACFLYRKRRKMKNYTQDSSACMTKGVPIIFSDELEEKSGPAKAPMIMTEEKGPLIPRHRHYPDDDDNHESVPLTEPKTPFQAYHPPPPFVAHSRDARGARPKIPSGYRQPPPYNVPP